jgi:lysophospholipase L1-like esterase
MKRITVFGGGTSHGLWDKKGGWVQRLKSTLNQKTLDSNGSQYYETFCLGVRGDNTHSVLDRFENELEAREKHDEGAENTLIFQVGANDAQFVFEEDDVKTSAEDFREQMNTLMDKADQRAENVIFLGLLPVNDEDVDPLPAIEGRSYTSSRMKHYTGIIKELCQIHNHEYIDIYSLFDEAGFEDYTEDGLHPDTEGHKMIFEEVRDRLAELDVV